MTGEKTESKAAIASMHSLRDLPSVDRLMGVPSAEALVGIYGRPMALEAIRAALDESRQAILEGRRAAVAEEAQTAARMG